MASLIPSLLPRDPIQQIIIVGASTALLVVAIFVATRKSKKETEDGALLSFAKFFYASFLKPHTGDGSGNGQQDALESFYKAQAGVYDATRKRLLCGREEMLGLVAAQLTLRAKEAENASARRVWVDVSTLPESSRPKLTAIDWWRHRVEYRGHAAIRVGAGLLL
jgi:betaine lipid synthase